MQIVGFQILYHNYSPMEKGRIVQSALNVCTSVLRNLGLGLACPTENGELAVLFRFEKDVSEQATREKMLEYASMLSGSLKRLLNVNVMAELCIFDDRVKQIRRYYLRAQQELEAKSFRSAGETLSMAGPVSLLAEKTLLDALSRADFSAIHKVVNELLSVTDNGAAVQAAVCRLLDIGEQFRAEYGIPGDSADPEPVRKSFELGLPMPDRGGCIVEYLSGLSAAAKKYHRSYSPPIQKAIAFIHWNYTDDISLSDVAEHSRISPVYLSTRFRAEVGETFVDYLTDCRVEAAKRLLESANTPVKDVYREAGFRNYNYFIQKFREKTGMTPLQYGKRHRL